MDELPVNLNAIAESSEVRASATTECFADGSQSAAAGLHLKGSGGRSLVEAQAKVMGDHTTAARTIVTARYEGTQHRTLAGRPRHREGLT